MLFIPTFKYVYYLDVLIISDEHRFYHYKKIVATINPAIAIEIFSEYYDSTYRWRAFQSIKSLTQYVLISQELPFVQKFDRQSGSAQWLYHSFSDLDDQILIGNCKLKVKDIYHKIVFPEKTAE